MGPNIHEIAIKIISLSYQRWKLYNIPLLYILLGFFLSIFLYVVVESFVSKQIYIQKFILGPEIERNDQQIDNEGLCDLIFKACN